MNDGGVGNLKSCGKYLITIARMERRRLRVPFVSRQGRQAEEQSSWAVHGVSFARQASYHSHLLRGMRSRGAVLSIQLRGLDGTYKLGGRCGF